MDRLDRVFMFSKNQIMFTVCVHLYIPSYHLFFIPGCYVVQNYTVQPTTIDT